MHTKIYALMTVMLFSTVHFASYADDHLDQQKNSVKNAKQTFDHQEKKATFYSAALPQTVSHELIHLMKEIENNNVDAREWYQKKRYWTLIGTAVFLSGFASVSAAAELATLFHASAETMGFVAGTTSMAAYLTAGAQTFHIINKHHGYELEIVENGTGFTKKEQPKKQE